MSHLIDGPGELVWVALKALLLYLTALVGFRASSRRTLAEMSAFVFAAAAAFGAIIGRVPNASRTSFLAGAVTLIIVLAAHAFVVRLRFSTRAPSDHRAASRLLVVHGKVLETELRRCGVTLGDLHGMLRQRGLSDVSDAKSVVFESRGQFSVFRGERAAMAPACPAWSWTSWPPRNTRACE